MSFIFLDAFINFDRREYALHKTKIHSEHLSKHSNHVQHPSILMVNLAPVTIKNLVYMQYMQYTLFSDHVNHKSAFGSEKAVSVSKLLTTSSGEFRGMR